MSQMVPFRYAFFYDVPRFIKLRYRGWTFLLCSAFDEVLDDYEEKYSVYRIPGTDDFSFREESWLFVESQGLLERRSLSILGYIDVKSVIFDERKHEELDATVLDPFTAADQG